MAHNVYGLSLRGADYYFLQGSRPSASISSSSIPAPASGNTYFPSSNGGFFNNNGVNQGFGDVVMNKSGVSPAFQQPAWPHNFGSALKRPHEQVSQGIIPSGNALTKRPRTDGMGGLPIFPQRPGQKDCKFYMTTRTCKFGDLCKFDHPVWVPAGGIPDWKEASSTTVDETLPERPGEPECTYYMKTGICKFGARCRFNHPSNRSKEDENDKVKEEFPAVEEGKGKEERGSELDNTDTVIKCEDKKEENKSERKDETEIKSSNKPENKVATFQSATVFNSKGLPIRPGESDCSFYIKMGSCKYGETCKFNHPDRKVNPSVAAVTLTPPSQSVMSLPFFFSQLVREHGQVRPSVTQQPGQHNFLLSQPSFAPSPQMPGQANFTLPQRPGQPECPVFSQIGKCDFGAMCQFNHTTVKLTLAGLPRREGADICAYYLKTGVCKYQAACRFDHPPPGEIEGGRFKPSVKLTPAGLPRREGEQFCDFYMKTGTCKFAANCRFDHPPPAEAAAKTSLKLPVPDDKAEEGLENGSVIISKEVNKDGGC